MNIRSFATHCVKQGSSSRFADSSSILMGLESGKSRGKARDLQKELRAWPPWRRIQRQYVSRKNWNASAFIFLCLSCRCLPERSSRRMIMWIPAGTLLLIVVLILLRQI